MQKEQIVAQLRRGFDHVYPIARAYLDATKLGNTVKTEITPEVDSLVRKIISFDWTYVYSDSGQTQRAGDARKDELLGEIARTIPMEQGNYYRKALTGAHGQVEMLKHCMPDHFRQYYTLTTDQMLFAAKILGMSDEMVTVCFNGYLGQLERIVDATEQLFDKVTYRMAYEGEYAVGSKMLNYKNYSDTWRALKAKEESPYGFDGINLPPEQQGAVDNFIREHYDLVNSWLGSVFSVTSCFLGGTQLPAFITRDGLTKLRLTAGGRYLGILLKA